MSFQRYGNSKRRGEKTAYYIVQNYHYNGGKQLERQTTNYKEAMRFASETPKAWIGAYTDDGALIGDYHQSPGVVPLNKRQLAARAREKAGHDHRNRSGRRDDFDRDYTSDYYGQDSGERRSTPRKGIPSIKTITTRLLHGLNETEQRVYSKEIRNAMLWKRDHNNALKEINKIIGGHGIEFIAQNPYGVSERDFGEHFEYVNMGDTYVPTVIYHRGKFKIASWGDLVESLERRGKRFQ